VVWWDVGEQRNRKKSNNHHFDPKYSVLLCPSGRGYSRAGEGMWEKKDNERITRRIK